MRLHLSIASMLATTLLLGGAARAQVKDPKFEYGKVEEVKKVEWKAQAKAGLIYTSGNSQMASVSLAGNVSRKEGNNKFALDASWAYARSNVLTATDDNANGVIDKDEVYRTDDTTTNAWMTKARYDRFFYTTNSAYLAALYAADRPAGKSVMGGVQIGYSRLVYKSPRHEATAEAGYDFSYESYISAADSISIHSLRLFAGYTLKLTDSTGLFGNFEALCNLNTEKVATSDTAPKDDEASAFQDTRLLLKLGASSTLWKKLSLSVGFTLKYDNVPAALSAFKIPFAAGYAPLAKKLDTITEAALIYTFL